MNPKVTTPIVRQEDYACMRVNIVYHIPIECNLLIRHGVVPFRINSRGNDLVSVTTNGIHISKPKPLRQVCSAQRAELFAQECGGLRLFIVHGHIKRGHPIQRPWNGPVRYVRVDVEWVCPRGTIGKGTDALGVAVEGGIHARRPSVLVGDVGVGAVRQQPRDHVGVIPLAGDVARRKLFVCVPLVQIGANVVEHVEDVRVATARRYKRRRAGAAHLTEVREHGGVLVRAAPHGLACSGDVTACRGLSEVHLKGVSQ